MSHPFGSEPYQNLLHAAQAEHDHGHYKEAVILAQTAVEIFTEKTLRYLYHARQIDYLKDAFEHLLINYNIGNTKVLRVYIALSGDNIAEAPFWSRFIDHTELRNDLVHEGKNASKDQSNQSLAAVAALFEHVTRVNSL